MHLFLWYLLSLVILDFQHVFEYFTERTPQSHFEEREASLVWNYRHAGNWVVFKKTCFLFPQLFLQLLNISHNHRCWVWKTSSKGHAATSLHRSNFKCISRSCSRKPIGWGASCWCYKGEIPFLIIVFFSYVLSWKFS